MKLPLMDKLGAIKGVFARLKPGAKTDDEDADDHLSGEDDDLFGDLGDLDQIDADAAERAAADAGETDGVGDDFDDLDDDDFTDDFDDEPDVLDELEDDHADHEFADLDDGVDDSLPPPPVPGDGGEDDLVAEIMGDLEEVDFGAAFDDEDDEEAAEAAQKEKLKKLLIMAGGGVAAAVVLGGVSWWLLGGDGADGAPEDTVAAVQDAQGGLVIDLGALPPAVQDAPQVQPDPVPSTQMPGPDAELAPVETGLAPPTDATDAPQAAPEALASAPQPDSTVSPEIAELRTLGLDAQLDPGVGVVIPSVTKASFAGISAWPAKAEALPSAPVETLVVQGEHGLLPVIGQDGTAPFDAYARPAPTEKSADPKIAIIVTGIGLSRAATEAAIESLPADVTLSLNVYARGLDFWSKQARQAGHEVLLDMPSESVDFPFTDPGPNALKSLATPAENLAQLEWMLSRTTGYFGVLGVYGTKFLTVEEQVKGVMDVLKQRGLMYVDGGVQDSLGTRVAYSVGAKWASVELTLDDLPGRKALALQLEELEGLAQKRAIAIARISADPASLKGLSDWLKTLKDKRLQLVPVSALANKQLIR